MGLLHIDHKGGRLNLCPTDGVRGRFAGGMFCIVKLVEHVSMPAEHSLGIVSDTDHHEEDARLVPGKQ